MSILHNKMQIGSKVPESNSCNFMKVFADAKLYVRSGRLQGITRHQRLDGPALHCEFVWIHLGNTDIDTVGPVMIEFR